jgi:hypothetical protein
METIKQSDTPIAAQLALAILGVSLLGSDHQHVVEQKAEAEMLTAAFRELEARKMDQTISALKHAEAQIGLAVKAAAMEAATAMDKVSMPFAGLGGAIKKGIGGAAQAAGRLVPKLSPTQKAVGAAGMAGMAYGGYKGMQALRDYGNAPTSHGAWGKGTPIMHNVNEFGYPQY